jgi:alpha-D-ribose 1-methylphosphonate 5-triphosphate diphosphatase
VPNKLVRALAEWSPRTHIDHRCHCRYEITDPDSLGPLLRVIAEDKAHLVSFMDHTPGRGQFKDAAAYQTFLIATAHLTLQEVESFVACKFGDLDSAPDVLQNWLQPRGGTAYRRRRTIKTGPS